MRDRIKAFIAALAVIVAGGAAVLTLNGSAANAAVDDPALKGQRVWCIDANGLPHYLPSPCGQYKGMWYFGNGANLYQGAAPVAPAPVAPTPTISVVTPIGADGNAPSLVLNGAPSEKSVPLKWTAGVAPSDDTIVGYEIRFRKTSVAAWTAGLKPGTVLAATVAKLEPGTMYYFEIRAIYNTTTGFGPWSNTITATTEATAKVKETVKS